MRKVVIKPLHNLRTWAGSINPGKNLPETTHFKSSEIEFLHYSFSEMANRLISALEEVSQKNNQLEQNKTQIKSISDNFTNGMIYQVITNFDGQRKFTYLSDSVQKLYNITPEEGMNNATLIYNKIHPDDLQPLIDAEVEAMKSLRTFRTEARLFDPSGKYRWSSFVSTPTPLKDGSVQWDGIEFDITNLKEAEDELRFSQQKLAFAFNSNPDVIFIIEVETGKIVEVNDAIMNIYGYTKEEVINKTTLDINIYKNPEDRKIIYQKINNNEPIKNLEMTGRHKSGSELTVLVSVEVSFIHEKQYLISTIHDLTQRKKAEEELRSSQQKYALVFNSISDVIFVTSLETNRIIEVNDMVTTTYGYTREEVLGKTALELGLYKNPEDRQKIFEKILNNEPIKDYELILLHKSGAELTISLSIEKSIVNGTHCLISTVHDLTERKKQKKNYV